MSNQLQKAIELAKNTGDKVIVFDNPQSENAFVVMPLDEYEEMVPKISLEEVDSDDVEDANEDYLTPNEKIDNINEEMTRWKEGHNFSVLENTNQDDFQEDIVDEEDYSEELKDEDQTRPADDNIIIGEENTSYNVDIEEKEDELDSGIDYEEKYLNKPRVNGGIWSIPSSRKTGAAKIVEGEETYLEDIPFDER